ncbi:hypothetical protein [Nocardia aurantiaca]|uniref:Uncharacterized protein n=1 Tax=Nocardia aurantiaca TaxID=2675850 RepID=A0A6I3KVN5_9NOCA|nr:hypothetical protein [Nocardia aurantiaca]MTE12610.1 hypothetical protein [Nocardia aurantiaca]
MVSFADKATAHRAAYQVRADESIADFPGGAPGTVYFSEGSATVVSAVSPAPQPDLAQVREWFPRYFPCGTRYVPSNGMRSCR